MYIRFFKTKPTLCLFHLYHKPYLALVVKKNLPYEHYVNDDRNALRLLLNFTRRTKELEKKQMDAEIERRVQEEIGRRMGVEMEKQKEAIEAEIQRRVGEARKQIEKELGLEHERQKQHDYKLQLEREVCTLVNFKLLFDYLFL
jgi:hypothetical protein